MEAKEIHQEVMFNTTPHEVYEFLMDSEKHSNFTGAIAKIGREVGDNNTAYDGWVESINVELIPDKKIVQKWRGKDWPKGHYSLATFKFAPEGETTRLTFIQTDVPEDQVEHISTGWHEQYWDKIKKSLRKQAQ